MDKQECSSRKRGYCTGGRKTRWGDTLEIQEYYTKNQKYSIRNKVDKLWWYDTIKTLQKYKVNQRIMEDMPGMDINFKPEDWKRVKDVFQGWRGRTIKRPILPIVLMNRPDTAVRNAPKAPFLCQATCHMFDEYKAIDFVESLDFHMSNYEFYLDAYPYVNLDSFGPGVIAAFLGARLDNSTGSVWFMPEEMKDVKDLHFEYRTDSIWYERILEFCRVAMNFWQGNVMVGMPDLGGVLDILATFVGTEELLMALYDEPEEIKRLSLEIHNVWHKYYNDINNVLQPINPGYTDWSGILWDKPGYIIQSDFGYMIGKNHFDEFVMPELVKTCDKLDYSIYHMDGTGQIPHLDSLLSIDKLCAIQWVPGSNGNPELPWTEIYERIYRGNKLAQVHYPELLFELYNLNGTDITYTFERQQLYLNSNERDKLKVYLAKMQELYGV